MSTAIIEMNNVTKHYHTNYSTTVALDNINLSIQAGEFVIIMGPSGSGKSTLLNSLSGLVHINQGSIQINGANIEQLKPDDLALLRQNSIGLIFQFYNLHQWLTALENVELPLIIANKLNRKARSQTALELLELVDLGDKSHKYPFELSGGEKQRVGIARALANNAPVIFADEPTGDLDSKNAQKIIDLFYSLVRKQKKTLIVVSHDLTLLRPGMRLVEIEDGSIKDDFIITEEYIDGLS